MSVDSEASVGGVAIPEINVTGVNCERMPNGDSLRPRPDGEAVCGTTEVGHEVMAVRSQEVRRQKSVRRMVESEASGAPSTGRGQH